jgi:O-acetyl-ADP-ribose deacetylase
MSTELKAGRTKICLTKGDITRQSVDGIVNAANSGLMGGGGVDGAIHRAGGPAILEECKQIRAMQGTCEPGKAVITGGGNLPVKFVIHTVGPIWRGGSTNESEILANAYKNSLLLAVQYEIKTIAFPSISTGAYGYPINEAAQIALNAVQNFCANNDGIDEVRFVVFDEFNLKAYEDALNKTNS